MFDVTGNNTNKGNNGNFLKIFIWCIFLYLLAQLLLKLFS